MATDPIMYIFEQFFDQRFGKSMVIKGKPGSGKTTFTLDFLTSIRDHHPVYYISSRTTDSAISEAYPWIKDRFSGEGEISKVKTDYLNRFEKMVEEGKFGDFLKDGLIIDMKKIVPIIHSLYEFVDAHVGERPIIALDSIDAIAEEYNIPEDFLFLMLKNDLVEGSGANLVTILEAKQNERLEYFADGVVSLDYNIKNDMLIRSLTLEKMRGISIGPYPNYMFSLAGGKFNSVMRSSLVFPDTKYEPTRISDPAEFQVSLGDPEYGKLTPEGTDTVPGGSIVILHLKDKGPAVNDFVSLFKTNLIITNIIQGRGVIDVTASGYETYTVLLKSLAGKYLNNYITTSKSDMINPYVISLKGVKLKDDINREIIEVKLAQSKGPYIYFFSSDYLYLVYGPEFLNQIIEVVDDIRTTGVIFIVADDTTYDKMFSASHISLDLFSINGYAAVSSNKTSSYLIQIMPDEKRWPKIRFIEIE
ncbi:MAG: ATPase [Thermoplasma acidophilum]|nr:ATPase [Thermoplasma acidophilum]